MAKKQSNKKISKREKIRAERRKRQRLTRIGIALVVLVVLGSALWLIAGPKAGVQSLTPSEAYQAYSQGVFILDVRSQEEWDEYHIPNATLIPLDEIPARLSELPKEEQILIVCHTGNRSKIAAKLLLEKGYKHISILEGGLNAWEDAGYPLTSQ